MLAIFFFATASEETCPSSIQQVPVYRDHEDRLLRQRMGPLSETRKASIEGIASKAMWKRLRSIAEQGDDPEQTWQ